MSEDRLENGASLPFLQNGSRNLQQGNKYGGDGSGEQQTLFEVRFKFVNKLVALEFSFLL